MLSLAIARRKEIHFLIARPGDPQSCYCYYKKKINIYVHFFNNSTNLVDRLAALKLSDVREPLLVRLDHVLYDPFRRAIFLFFIFYF
jgi:hypothetical protein